MTFKYLSDGRKVKVLGKLNSQEMIVQEIFITAQGDEIPSGESFTVKSLHDEPVISYMQKQEKVAEQRLNEAKSEIEKAERELKNILIKLNAYKDTLKSTKALVENFDKQNLDILTGFMTGTIKYLVVDHYTITKPVKMIDEIISLDTWNSVRYDGIKLCSVLGRSDGYLSYKINQYYDGSGSNTSVYPFTNKEDALNHIKSMAIEKINSKSGLSEEEFSLCLEMGIKFDDDTIKKHTGNVNAQILSSIKSKEEKIAKEQKEIDKLSEKLKDIL